MSRCIAIDFDGVIHTYYGWRDGILDKPIPGMLEFITLLRSKGAEVVVFSTRDKGVIRTWLKRWKFPDLEVTDKKLQRFSVFIDDRNVLFTPSLVSDAKQREFYAQEVMTFTPNWRHE